MNGNPSAFDAKQFFSRALVGLIFALLAAGPVLWLVVMRDQVPNRAQQFVLYVCLALIAGLIFTAASISTGELNLKYLGISLTGGAAIGIATIMIVNRLIPPVPTPAVINPPITGLISKSNHGSCVRITPINSEKRYLIELEPGEYNKDEAWVEFEVLQGELTPTSKTDKLRYQITAEGRVQRVEVK